MDFCWDIISALWTCCKTRDVHIWRVFFLLLLKYESGWDIWTWMFVFAQSWGSAANFIMNTWFNSFMILFVCLFYPFVYVSRMACSILTILEIFVGAFRLTRISKAFLTCFTMEMSFSTISSHLQKWWRDVKFNEIRKETFCISHWCKCVCKCLGMDTLGQK